MSRVVGRSATLALIAVVLLSFELLGVDMRRAQARFVFLLLAVVVEWMRRDAGRPWWAWGAHLFTAGTLLLAFGRDEAWSPVYGPALCALGAPFVFKLCYDDVRRARRSPSSGGAR